MLGGLYAIEACHSGVYTSYILLINPKLVRTQVPMLGLPSNLHNGKHLHRREVQGIDKNWYIQMYLKCTEYRVNINIAVITVGCLCGDPPDRTFNCRQLAVGPHHSRHQPSSPFNIDLRLTIYLYFYAPQRENRLQSLLTTTVDSVSKPTLNTERKSTKTTVISYPHPTQHLPSSDTHQQPNNQTNTTERKKT